MDVWHARETKFESEFEISAALRFRSVVRRNRLLGLWAAEKLGLEGPAANDYAKRLVEDQIGRDDDEALALRFESEFANLDPPLSAHRIRRRINELTAVAAREVFEGQ
ncbi:MAG: ATPase inhibitor subunit zeta [Roseiarcus sp.]